MNFTFYFFTVQVFIFFTPIRRWIHREWAPTVQVPLHWFSWSAPLWEDRLELRLHPGPFLSGFLLFLTIFLQASQEAFLALSEFKCSAHTLSPWQGSCPFVYNEVKQHAGLHCSLSHSAVVSFVGHSILNSICSLDIDSIIFILDLQGCGQRTNKGPCFPKA